MKLTVKESDYAVLDEVFAPEEFKQFTGYFNKLDFAYRSITGWQKVWRVTDGQILSGRSYYHSRIPEKDGMNWLDKIVYSLAKNNVKEVVGEEGKDWVDILYTPYIYPPGTKISWHNDYGYSAACIFYTHDIWNSHWGGELLVAKTPSLDKIDVNIEQNEMTRNYVEPLLNYYGVGNYISPLPNRMVFTSGNVWHSINRVDATAGDHMRCSIVAFFVKEKKDA